ncbi:DUF1648 domain-containing protein [Eggerthellaceae bacterium zg-887]|uniref:DUF1648 domain-containing protein n=1 Tax=Xiamenia xianingshaonis TaxID=2682776 RepID=UPI00140AE104|nr:DUF1648 domain-containing protein [Xiamenia xianingshaonis]NHM16968.1 DUF1648 domain-containing protein [Xiamenia xianingshaonis]
MSFKKSLVILLWIAVIATPAVASLIAIAQFPPNIEIPMHWNAQGQVDRFGSPWQMLPVSLIISGSNVLLALSYAFSDKLFDLGLVHGISRRATRPVLCGTAVFLDIVWIGILVFWLCQVGQTSF